MINKDIVYIGCFILIVINCLIYNSNDLPEFIESPLFKAIYLVLILIIANINIYIGLFLGITFLSLNQ
jgi:hypothetical protein